MSDKEQTKERRFEDILAKHMNEDELRRQAYEQEMLDRPKTERSNTNYQIAYLDKL